MISDIMQSQKKEEKNIFCLITNSFRETQKEHLIINYISFKLIHIIQKQKELSPRDARMILQLTQETRNVLKKFAVFCGVKSIVSDLNLLLRYKNYKKITKIFNYLLFNMHLKYKIIEPIFYYL